jgi:rhomboid protease GluP
MDSLPEHVADSDAAWCLVPASLKNREDSRQLTGKQARLWALVLQARSIPCYLDSTGAIWHLHVPANAYSIALEELQQHAAENRNWPPPAPPARKLAENTLATICVLLLLATFHNITLLDISLNNHSSIDWLAIGAAQVDLIRDGEWWRSVTALTLHANLPHLLSNLAIGGFIIHCLCREVGSGIAWSLLLSSGILGNLLNAQVQPATHSSVGASTVVFGAVGLLAAHSLVHYRHQRRNRWGLPIAGAMALLAALGTEGERTDLGAHLFGYLAGLGIGLLAAWHVERHGRPSRGFSLFLALLSATVVVASWWLALAHNNSISR